ncbi:MAG: hypothetical protein ABW019_10125 [Chitinophagaceae bacterium]
MPRIYACVFNRDAATGNRSVLIGKKRIQARWLNWNSASYDVPFQHPSVQVSNRVPYDITDNPGQPVFSGGEQNIAEQEVLEGDKRFWEDTGIDLLSLYPGHTMSIPSYPGTIKRFTNEGQPVATGQPPAFTAVYFELPQALYQAVYMQAFTNILYNNLTSRPPNMQNDELDFICSMPQADAAQWFTDANISSCRNRCTDRFNVILRNLP